MAEWLDTYFAVFNQHIDGAQAKTREIMGREFPALLHRVDEIDREGKGIMAIFGHAPEAATLLYAGLIAAHVNGRVAREYDALRAVAEAARTWDDRWYRGDLSRFSADLKTALDRLDAARGAGGG